MIVVWRGLGVGVLWIFLASLLGGAVLANVLFGDDVHVSLIGLTIFLIAAVLTLILALIARRSTTVPTNQGTKARQKHELYFIPIGWWAILYMVFGIVFYLGFGPLAARP